MKTQFEDSFAALETLTTPFGGIDQPDTRTALQPLIVPETVRHVFLADPARQVAGGYYEVTRPSTNPDEHTRRQQAGSILCGQLVIVPWPQTNRNIRYYPAAVSLNQQPSADHIRLHVHHEPLHLQQPTSFSDTAHILLSGSIQSELQGIGEHKGSGAAGIEPEHGITLLRAALDPQAAALWRAGQHPNHQWRAQGRTVMATVSTESNHAPSLFQDGQRQNRLSTITFPLNRLPLYWHETLAAYDMQAPALHLVQAAGFLTVYEHRATETLKQLTETSNGNN